MFFETHNIQADKQGRISLPANLFRSGSIFRGGMLCVFPMQNYWIACSPERINTLLQTEYPGNSVAPEVRNLRREFMISVLSLHIDLQGRIHVSNLKFSQANGSYVLVGMGFDFEIWSASSWQEQKKHSGGGKNE